MSLNSALIEKGLHGLRKTNISHDASAPRLGPQFAESQADFKQYQSKVMDINLEEWLYMIPDHTFRTEMMPITPEDAELFVASYLELEAHMDKSTLQGPDSRLEAAQTFQPSPPLLQKMEDLQHRIQQVIDKVQNGDSKQSVFVKTSCRSPKDAPTTQSNLRKIYENLVASTPDRSENVRLAHLLRAGVEVMRVQEASDALALLTRSRRIWQDMTLALENKDRWNQHIIVRQWQDMDVDMEFRCFVKGGNLTAISQYNSLCYFPRVVEQQVALKNKLFAFFENHLRECLAQKFSEYVVDLAVLEDGQVKVIELNPFLETTDGACFNWVRDRDILEGSGQDSDLQSEACVMRVTESPMLGAKALMEETWRAMLECVQ